LENAVLVWFGVHVWLCSAPAPALPESLPTRSRSRIHSGSRHWRPFYRPQRRSVDDVMIVRRKAYPDASHKLIPDDLQQPGEGAGAGDPPHDDGFVVVVVHGHPQLRARGYRGLSRVSAG